MTPAQLVEEFKAVVGNREISDAAVVNRFVSHGTPFLFQGKEALYFELKDRVASFYKVHPESVRIVGSAKMGFSLAPQKLWKPFDVDSDIDVVVISAALFDHFWLELLDFNVELTPRTITEDQQIQRFLFYMFKGWVRPDLFPRGFGRKDEWDGFFKELSYKDFGQFKIAGAVYRSLDFFDRYHLRNIASLRAAEHGNE